MAILDVALCITLKQTLFSFCGPGGWGGRRVWLLEASSWRIARAPTPTHLHSDESSYEQE